MNVVVCIEPPGPGPAALHALDLATRLGAPTRPIVLCVRAEAEAPELPRQSAPPGLAVVAHPAIAALDPLRLGELLALGARHLAASLVLTGSRSGSRGLGATGAAIARHLGWPYLARIESLALDGAGEFPTSALVELRSGGKLARLQVPLPAVLTVAPRLPAGRRRRASNAGAAPEIAWLDPTELGAQVHTWDVPELPAPDFEPFTAQVPTVTSSR